MPRWISSMIIDEPEKESGKTVCFVGDGINDAPVLTKSDCGVAMGFGSEAAIEAADAVLSSGDLTALPKAVRLARKTLNTIRANIIFALAVKAACDHPGVFRLGANVDVRPRRHRRMRRCVLYTARLKLKVDAVQWKWRTPMEN